MIALNMAKVALLFPKYDPKGDGAFALSVGTLLLEAPAVFRQCSCPSASCEKAK